MIWYDAAEMIHKATLSLEAFHHLVRERHIAGYTRRESLTEYIVLGRYQLDTCGNCSRVTSDDGAKLGDAVPPVLTRAAFWALQPPEASISCRLSGRSYATPEQRCAICGLGWRMANAHDIQTASNVKDYPLAMFKGWALGSVIRHFETRTDAEYSRDRGHLLRSDRFVDLSPRYPGATEEWKKSALVNEHGWLKEGDLSPETIIQGDEAIGFHVLRAKHTACAAYERAQNTLRHARDLFGLAATLKAVPNLYWQHEEAPPWVEARTTYGTFTLGRRKRVWVLKYEGETDRFPDWPHTHGGGYLHAWSNTDLENAIQKFRKAACAAP